ncbi:hypothetical protein PHYPSEUDO_001996 [Phytophthora pseudosyringae]|uniref:Uncharacterized protein n=1 Tax=Phytophthora pseudosyringae TaxID=221518 RepID=A0A8T1V4L9_9STRA|nr:hypothetical protein PHYPSEUDO_001996 [Phytophthora pseudosyringae]
MRPYIVYRNRTGLRSLQDDEDQDDNHQAQDRVGDNRQAIAHEEKVEENTPSPTSSSSSDILEIWDGQDARGQADLPAQRPAAPPMNMHPIPNPVYPVFADDDLDIDYMELTGPCSLLGRLSRLTSSFATDSGTRNGLLLVAKGPGYVYVDKSFKAQILVQLQEHFGYTFEPHDDELSLLKWQRRRVVAHDLSRILDAAHVPTILFADYAMKASVRSFDWIDEVLQSVPDTTLILDVATYMKPSAPGRTEPYFGTVSTKRRPDCPDTDEDAMLEAKVYSRAHHIFKSTLQPGSVERPGTQRYIRTARTYFNKLHIAYMDQQAVMGDMRTDIRFRVRSIAEVARIFSQEYANLWSHLRVLDTEVDLVLRMQEKTMEWVDNPEINLFSGRDEDMPSHRKKDVYNILLNVFGFADKFSRHNVRNSTLMSNLKAFLVLNGVRMGPAIAVDDDEDNDDEDADDTGEPTGAQDDEIEVDDEDTAPDYDSEETQRDPDTLFRTIFSRMVTTRKRHGRRMVYILRDHFGQLITRRLSEAMVAQVVLERFGVNWHRHIMHTGSNDA